MKAYKGHNLPTMIIWTNELMQVNIQIGGDMYRMPAHMANMAPVW